MGDLVIPDVEVDLEAALRVRAAMNGRSIQEEAKRILGTALSARPASRTNLVDAIRRHLLPDGGVDLDIAEREPVREPPDFD